MRVLPLIILLFILDYFAFQAFVAISEDWSNMGKTILNTVYWMIPILAIGLTYSFSTGAAAKWSKNTFTIVRSSIMLSYFSKFLIIAVLILGDVGQLILSLFEFMTNGNVFDFGRTKLVSQVAVATGVIPFFTLLYGILRNQYRYKIYNTSVTIPDLPKALEGLKIVQISDIHSGSFTKKHPIKVAIDMINDQRADLVFFTGDLVNSISHEMEPFVDIFDKIKSRYGIFSILGNHDYGDYVRWESATQKEQNLENLKNIHLRLGWDLILNDNRLVKIKGEDVAVIGVENYSAHGRFMKYGDLAKANQGTDEAGLKLLLSHDPSHWEDEVLEKFKDIHITFSGHTHGAQFGLEIPGIIKWSPIKYVYKQWAGLYQKNKQYLYVNRGFGFLGYPGRVGILPEITVMELRKK
ncbi:MAG: metallophosphoesterase [Saprospiraceae bacterium]